MKGLGYPLYVNGKLFQEPVTISHVPASGLGADRDPSMGGLGRLSGLGQYVQYYPNFPMGADDASSEEVSPNVRAVAAMIGTAIVGAGIYHGYKRNNSVGWAIGWGLMAGMFPIITIPIAIAQGFGKPKEMRSNKSRRRRRKRNAHAYHKVKVIPPAWVGKPGSESMAYFTWYRDPSAAHEFALKQKERGAKVLITPTNEKPPWQKNGRRRRRSR